MLLATSKIFLLASLANIPPTYTAVPNLPGYDFLLLFWQYFGPIWTKFVRQTLQNSRNLQSFILS